MASQKRSLRLTDAYRVRLAATLARARAFATATWPTIERLDSTEWPQRVARFLTAAQLEAARSSAGYLTAYLTSELGRPVRGGLANDLRRYAGTSRDGRPLSEALVSPLVAVRGELAAGSDPTKALAIGLTRGLRMVELDLMAAARGSLADLMEHEPRVEGWQRAVRGTCAACLGDIEVEVSVQLPSVPLTVHPNCQCVTQPVVSGVRDRFPLAIGAERFRSMTKAEQDRGLGPEAAQRVRDGLPLRELIAVSPQATADDFITQKPLKQVDDPGGH